MLRVWCLESSWFVNFFISKQCYSLTITQGYCGPWTEYILFEGNEQTWNRTKVNQTLILLTGLFQDSDRKTIPSTLCLPHIPHHHVSPSYKFQFHTPLVPHKNGQEPLNGVIFTLPTNKCSILVDLIIHIWKRCSLPCGALFVGRVIQAFWMPICW